MRKWLALLTIPALLLGACSNEGDAPAAEDDPTGALVAAFEETAASEAQTITISLQSTPESLAAAAEGSELPPEAAETILGSSITVTGTKAEDPADQSFRMTLAVPNSDGAEVIFSGGDLYLRADVRGLAEAFGQDTTMIDQFLQSPTAQQAPFLEPAVNGEFIRIEGTEELTGGTGGTAELGQQQEQILREFSEAIRADAEVTSEGEDDVGEHLVVSIPFQTLMQRFTELASQLGGGLAPTPPESEVPEGDFTFDVWIADGRVAQMELDIVQLSESAEGDVPEGVEELAVRMEFSEEAEDITPPEDAVTVTGEQIMGLIFGGAFGGGGFPGDTPTDDTSGGGGDDTTGGGGGDDICSVYEGLPPETFEGLPQETLDQIEQLCPEIVPNS